MVVHQFQQIGMQLQETTNQFYVNQEKLLDVLNLQLLEKLVELAPKFLGILQKIVILKKILLILSNSYLKLFYLNV